MFLKAYPSCLHNLIKKALFTILDDEIADTLLIEKPNGCTMLIIRHLLYFRGL